MELPRLITPLLWVILMVVGVGMVMDYLLFKKELAARSCLAFVGLVGLLTFGWVCFDQYLSTFQFLPSNLMKLETTRPTYLWIHLKPPFNSNEQVMVFHPLPCLKKEDSES